jgi:hypothetical protein
MLHGNGKVRITPPDRRMDKLIDWFLCGSTTTIRVTTMTTTTTTTIATLRTREMFGCRLSLYGYPKPQQMTHRHGSGPIVNTMDCSEQKPVWSTTTTKWCEAASYGLATTTTSAHRIGNLLQQLQHARADILAAWTASDALACVQKTRPAMSTRQIEPYLPIDDRVPMIRASVRTTWPLVVDTVDHVTTGERST